MSLDNVKMIDRQQMFRSVLASVVADLNRNPNIRRGRSYAPGVTRKRFRNVARSMAREEMRLVRRGR